MTEVAAARHFSALAKRGADLRDVRGMPQRHGGPRPKSRRWAPIWCSPATRCASRSATERSGFEFYNHAARITRDARGRKVFRDLAQEEKHHLGQLEARYNDLLQRDPQLESRPTFLFFKRAASGLFAEAAAQLEQGVDDRQALLIGIECERGSHRFFKKYGEQFEDTEGKQIFLDFAKEERAHLDLLKREYRALRKRQGWSRGVARATR